MTIKNNPELDNDPILPEGYEEGDDLFAEEPEEDAPTIEQPTEETDPPEPVEEPEPTTEPDPEPKAKIKVKFNHEERELDEDEARPFITKGMNYDKKVQELDAAKQQLSQFESAKQQLLKAEQVALRMGFKTPEEMFEAAEKTMFDQKVAELVEDGVHEAIAKDIVSRQMEKQQQKAMPVTVPEVTPEPKPDPVEQEIDEFVKAYPGVDKLPEEVVEATKQGIPLRVAYARYETKKAQEELKILKQNQASAAKAPVASTTKHGSSTPEKEDPFVKGFDSDDW